MSIENVYCAFLILAVMSLSVLLVSLIVLPKYVHSDPLSTASAWCSNDSCYLVLIGIYFVFWMLIWILPDHQFLVIFLLWLSYQPVNVLVSKDFQHSLSHLDVGSMSTRVPNVYLHMHSRTPSQAPQGTTMVKGDIPVSYWSCPYGLGHST